MRAIVGLIFLSTAVAWVGWTKKEAMICFDALSEICRIPSNESTCSKLASDGVAERLTKDDLSDLPSHPGLVFVRICGEDQTGWMADNAIKTCADPVCEDPMTFGAFTSDHKARWEFLKTVEFFRAVSNPKVVENKMMDNRPVAWPNEMESGWGLYVVVIFCVIVCLIFMRLTDISFFAL